MNKATAKKIMNAIVKEQQYKGVKCCNCSRGGCLALSDDAYFEAFLSGKCDTLACPFYKPDKDLIRIGDVLLTEDEFKAYKKTKVTVNWLNKRLDELDNYALEMHINLDNAEYERGMRAGISYAVDYMAKQLRKVRIEKDEQQNQR